MKSCFLLEPRPIKMIDWSLQRDSLHPQNSLIAFSPVSPQMLNLDSQPHWQNDVRQQMTSFKQEARGWGGGGGVCVWNLDKQWEQCPHHFSPLTSLPMHEFKAGKTMAGFVSIWHPSCRSALWFHCTVSTIRCFGNRPMTSVKAPQEKLGPIWRVGF